MALRASNPLVPKISRSGYSGEVKPARISIRASDNGLKEKKRSFSGFSPSKEDFFRLDLDLTVRDLERLFQQKSGAGNDFSGRPVRVAYQGVRGSYCQEAAMKSYTFCNALPCNQMEEAFKALEEKTADRAIIPVENSIDGQIGRNFDLLVRHNASIVGESIFPVNHCLLAIKGCEKTSIKRIVSHPQAISHCKTRLEALGLEIEEVSNSAEAAKILSENSITDTAVIGSQIAAKEFGLQILEQNLQERNGNFNRFFHLALSPATFPTSSSGNSSCKTTIAFSLENGVSDLARALLIFETRDIPVTRVDHRPNRSRPIRVVKNEEHRVGYFDYVFLLDIEGHESDPKVEKALQNLNEVSGFLRVLGSYT
ncbi:hypothetical protein AMTRI_Chr02g220390 [Amborella trichopoda]|uniref:arogenate dehydratase n=1 Tax=Amborella trichopoda TaxID=13333 RepID=W1P8B2_AMBTC|nr:arogenate dehydratase/prephenate dehydratase 6, chloroplastic [Amborella trichopoda]ERN03215.1 hypothetical protein AMTR_s00003p00164060 [Amborella trichopoda]|eukprot:XP_006841540.1 arogenate dehydratase/prephenate dehydratase 6, chloroplastic [Amborella trichopoda]